MSAQHTPGPWWPCESPAGSWDVRTYRDDEDPKTSRHIGSEYGASIATDIGDHTERRTRGNEEANARLIAAAPDLLEALRLCIPRNVCLTNPNVRDDTILPMDVPIGDLRRIAAVIAKAEGR